MEYDTLAPFEPSDAYDDIIFAPGTNCRYCGKSGFTEKIYNAKLYTLTRAYEVKVHSHKCNTETCKRITYYDGLLDKIYNHNSKALYTHSLLNNRSNTLHINNTTWNAWWKEKTRDYMSCGSPFDFPSQQIMQRVWTSFIHIQEWNNTFTCPWCDRGNINDDQKGEVDCVIGDGITVSLPKKFATKVYNPTTILDTSYYINNYSADSTRYISNRDMRTILHQWYQSLFGKMRRETKHPAATVGEVRKMDKYLRENYKSFYNFKRWVIEQIHFFTETEKFVIEHFIRAVISNEPIYQLLPPKIYDVIIEEVV